MEEYFKLKENGTTARTEVYAGITTFMAMGYILFVNAGMFTNLVCVSYQAMYIATAIAAVIGTVLSGLIANLPLAQASGMGLNAFFVYTICMGFGFTYQNALLMVLIDGIVFTVLTVTGLRRFIFESIPKEVKTAIPAGIGLFIAYIGFQSAGIIVADSSTASALTSLNIVSGSATWAKLMPIFVTVLTIAMIATLTARHMRGAVLTGMLIGTVFYYILGSTVTGFYEEAFSGLSFNFFDALKEWWSQCFCQVFTKGFDFSEYIALHGKASFALSLVTSMLAFCLVDMFDTLGTLYGACARGGMVDTDGNVKNVEGAMLADALATMAGSVCGTSTVTTFVESSAGIAEGGRTGLSALATAALFFIAMFFAPIASVIPSSVTSAALIYVGVLMLNCVRDIEWTDSEIAVPAFLTISVMAFSYSISNGIGIGVISYTIVKIFSGKIKEVNIGTWIIDILFLAMFLLSH